MKKLSNRLTIFYCLAILLSLVLLGRIVYIQRYNEDYKTLADEQRKNIKEVNPPRGNIYDSQGNALAETVKSNSLYLYPYYVNDEVRLVEFLEKSLGIDNKEIQKAIKSEDKTRIKEKLSGEEIDKINTANLAGLKIETDSERSYPNNDYAAHVLGFLDGEGHGLYGLEAYYDDILFGEPGLNIENKSATGGSIPYEKPEKQEAYKGSDLVLTINPTIQELVDKYGSETYEEFKPKKLTVIVMDPNNGNILAMENFPNYDPNEPRKSVQEEYKDQNISDEELTNHLFERWRSFATNDVYEPGSIFKCVTAAAAYEEKVATDNTVYPCTGIMEEVPGMPVYCHVYPNGHGDQNIEEAMANSCNPAFTQMGFALGNEKMLEYINKFGFNDPTKIDLPGEIAGMVPETVEDLTQARLATTSFGHGIALTPIQVATAISSIVNGGTLYQPKLVAKIIDGKTGQEKSIKDIKVREVISENTSNRMKELMVYGVDHGTANGAQIPGFAIAGKTGTSEKFVDGSYNPDITVASFVGVYPVDKPEYVILTVADEPEGATSGNVVTSPLVKKIIEGLIDMRSEMATRELYPNESIEDASDETEPSIEETEYTEEISENPTETEIPDVTGYSIGVGVIVLNEYGFSANISSDNYNEDSIIILQDPMGGEYAPEGSTIDIIAE